MNENETAPQLQFIEQGEGFADITLSKDYELDGVKLNTLRMREPSVEDQLAMEAIKGNAGKQEISLLANLCERTPADIQKLKSEKIVLRSERMLNIGEE